LSLLLCYVSSYIVLSRRGFAMCREAGMNDMGLYFFVPEESASWRWRNYGCVVFYYPLVQIDNTFITGRGIGCEPLWRLSDKRRSSR
jgi:hypothetical protein